jgi:hypothetical protein
MCIMLVSCLVYSLTLKMETTRFLKRHLISNGLYSVIFHKTEVSTTAPVRGSDPERLKGKVVSVLN